jgi:hypothetical protein
MIEHGPQSAGSREAASAAALGHAHSPASYSEDRAARPEKFPTSKLLERGISLPDQSLAARHARPAGALRPPSLEKFSTNKLLETGIFPRHQSLGDRELPRTPRPLKLTPKNLPRRLVRRSPTGVGGSALRAKAGWTPARRARQAASIRGWQPWRRSTGPKTGTGKARVAMNGLRHGHRSRAWIERAKRIRRAIRLCAQTVLLVRAHVREQERLALLKQVQRKTTPSLPPAHRSHFTALGMTSALREPGVRPRDDLTPT